jgi:hypothetical protein
MATSIVIPRPAAPPNMGGIPIHNTRTLINPDTRICMLLYGFAKRGKTTFAATLDKLTRKYMGKPTFFIAVEPGEGGGTMSIQDLGIDYTMPRTYSEFKMVLAALASDTRYGGIVLDSATEYSNRLMKPRALKYPYTKGTAPATRSEAGVPEQGDYQTMGEMAREDFNHLINLTTHPDLNVRKHLLITATEKEKTDRAGVLLAVQPDLPGAVATSATAMMQTVGSIEFKTTVGKDATGKPTRVTERYLVTSATEESKKILGDRTKCIPNGAPMDFAEIWEKYWIPRFEMSGS